jgi:hypothetical protein
MALARRAGAHAAWCGLRPSSEHLASNLTETAAQRDDAAAVLAQINPGNRDLHLPAPSERVDQSGSRANDFKEFAGNF